MSASEQKTKITETVRRLVGYYQPKKTSFKEWLKKFESIVETLGFVSAEDEFAAFCHGAGYERISQLLQEGAATGAMKKERKDASPDGDEEVSGSASGTTTAKTEEKARSQNIAEKLKWLKEAAVKKFDGDDSEADKVRRFLDRKLEAGEEFKAFLVEKLRLYREFVMDLLKNAKGKKDDKFFQDAVLDALPEHVKLTVDSLVPREERNIDKIERVVTNCQKVETQKETPLSPSKVKEKKVCHGCGKPGHFVKDCPQKSEKKSSEGMKLRSGREKRKVNVILDEEEERSTRVVRSDEDIVLTMGEPAVTTPVRIGGSRTVDAVVDTGASISAIDARWASGLKWRKSKPKVVRLADGGSMVSRKRVFLTICRRAFPFWILPQLHGGVVVGADVLKALGATVYCDSKKSKVRFLSNGWKRGSGVLKKETKHSLA